MNKILFFGELPNSVIHGISISNKINLDILSKEYNIDKVEERTSISSIGKMSLSKIASIIYYFLLIIIKSFFKNYNIFYLALPTSKFGLIKTLVLVEIFRIMNSRKSKVILHMFRGDFSLKNQKIVKRLFDVTDAIIVLSESQKIEFSNYFEKNIYVLESAIEYEYECEKKHTNEKLNFIYISNYIRTKGILDLLEAFSIIVKKYDNINLNCYGAFSDDTIYSEVMKYKSNNIHINDTINGKDKFEEICKSSCLVLPSWNEGQPLVLIEAMSVGTPVIATKVGLIDSILGEEYEFYFDVKSVKDLVVKIEKFILNSHKTEISKKFKHMYLNKFSNKIHNAKLQTIFGEIVNL